jgi:hypothetical protein
MRGCDYCRLAVPDVGWSLGQQIGVIHQYINLVILLISLLLIWSKNRLSGINITIK